MTTDLLASLEHRIQKYAQEAVQSIGLLVHRGKEIPKVHVN